MGRAKGARGRLRGTLPPRISRTRETRMSNKIISVLGVLAAGLGLLAATTQGCGGSSSSGNVVDTCDKLCDKEASCNPAIVALMPGFAAQCKSSCASSANGGSTGSKGVMTSCPGVTTDQAIAKANTCLAGTCDNLDSCLGAICPGGSGTAGTSGTAGSTGAAGHAGSSGSGNAGSTGAAGFTGGAGFGFDGGFAGFGLDGGFLGTAGTAGSTCDTACTKAQACCIALGALTDGGSSDCTLKMDCDNAGANMAQAVASCNAELQVSAILGPNQPAACK